MNILNKTRCYLAGNLQEEDPKFTVSWRAEFKQEAEKMGIVTLSPLDRVFINFELESPEFREKMFECLESGDMITVHEKMKAIRRRDLAMIDHSNFVVAVLNATLPTFGTIEELSFAQRANKPVFIVVTPNYTRIPLWLLGMFKPTVFYRRLRDVIDDLKSLDSGERDLNQEEWRIFSPEYYK